MEQEQGSPSGHVPDQAVGVDAPASTRRLDIRFTGSGSEYFRIWIVNVLLTIVTLSLYWPFAKARRIRYFYANTLVDGHALSFHGDPRKMLRGHLLLLLLGLVYSVAGRFSPVAGAVAVCVLGAIGPALWRAGLQFRLGNTAWRGLRFGFNGTLRNAYLAFLPALIMGAILIVSGAMLDKAERVEEGAEADPLTGAIAVAVGVLALVAFVATPWVLARVKRYQHRGYVVAAQQGDIRLKTNHVYGVFVKAFGTWILAVIAMAAVVIGLMALGPFSEASETTTSLLSMTPILASYLLYFALIVPLFTARFQDLVWNGTTSQDLAFKSDLRFGPFFRLTLKNVLLTVLTIGLYRPFAAVHTARMQIGRAHV